MAAEREAMRKSALSCRRVLFSEAFVTTAIVKSNMLAHCHTNGVGEEERGKRIVAEVPDAWWRNVIRFSRYSSIIDLLRDCSRMMKVSSFLSLVLSFASIFFIANADDKSTTLDILMPDAVATHVGSLVCPTHKRCTSLP